MWTQVQCSTDGIGGVSRQQGFAERTEEVQVQAIDPSGEGEVAVVVGGGVGQQHGVLIAAAPLRNLGTALHRQFACRRRIDMLINVSSPGDTLDKHFISRRERSAGDQIASRCDIWTHLADWQFITRRRHFTRRFPFG